MLNCAHMKFYFKKREEMCVEAHLWLYKLNTGCAQLCSHEILLTSYCVQEIAFEETYAHVSSVALYVLS